VAIVLIVLYVASLVFTLVTHQHLFRTSASEGGPTWPAGQAVGVLLGSALVVGLESELLVGALQPTVAALGISEVFIGLFVVAIIGNAAEHATAVIFALRNQADITIEIAFGSASQIAMFVAPALVFISLALGHPMDFIFTPLEVGAVTLATVIAVLITLDGRTNWLEGLQLLGVYVIIAVSFFFVPS
jgi:Ca2+:H+ antiporter